MSTQSTSAFTYPQDLAPLVQRLMDSGQFATADDLLRAALTFYAEQEEKDDWPAIEAALAQVDSGAPCKPIEVLMEEFKQRRSKA
jgi:Arc/MetJ-type ribon-helix-helix transcriptional regulator